MAVASEPRSARPGHPVRGPEVLQFQEFTPPDRPRRKGQGASDPRIGRVYRCDGAGGRLPPAAAARLRARATTSSACWKPQTPRPSERGLRPGTRVAGCLARMGGYTSQLDVPSARLVAVPDALDSAQAAALPLDLVTAAVAVDLADPPSGATIFVQGVSGAVGALITQPRRRRNAGGRHRVGSHAGLRRIAGRPVVDYQDPTWPQRVRDLVPERADAASTTPAARWCGRWSLPQAPWCALRGAAAFRSRAHGRRARRVRPRTSAGMRVHANGCARYHLSSLLQPGKYRKLLHDQLNRIVDGRLRGPTVATIPFANVVDAHRGLARLAPGHKLVLEMTQRLRVRTAPWRAVPASCPARARSRDRCRGAPTRPG